MNSHNCHSHVSFNASFVHDLVNVVGRHTRLSSSGSKIQDFTGESADFAHALLLSLVEDGDLVPANEDLF